MKVGMIGLGALGMPVAVAMARCGHQVIGYDINADRMQKNSWPFKEAGPPDEPDFKKALQKSTLEFSDLGNLVSRSEIIFLCVQTPHAPVFEGVTRLSDERRDFDYSYLIAAVDQIVAAGLVPGQTVAVISTVMPGTLRREIFPRLPDSVTLAHTPFFEAMGSVIKDFLKREFVLIGTDSPEAAEKLDSFFSTVTQGRKVVTSIENAEAIKVFYNTFTSMKIVFANCVMEACHKIEGCNVDEVLGSLKLATDRLISPRYLSGGMGDGGVCHPRDNIALSWFAREYGLSFDLFGALMQAREAQAEWLISLMEHWDLPKFILGTAFKAGSNIQTGSCAILCKNLLKEKGFDVQTFDPEVDEGRFDPQLPHVFLIGCNHPCFSAYRFPEGSVVIDPWRVIPSQSGVRVIGVGDRSRAGQSG